MRIRVLGSGTSTGVPEIGCQCEVCTSCDPRDRRTRCSSLIETEDARILVDCGPDFWVQAQTMPFQKIDAVLITHEHYDHVGGIDDLRPFCRFDAVDIYAEDYTAEHLRTRLPYCFSEKKYPGVPLIALHDLKPFQPFWVNQTEIIPIRVLHGKMPILGYRIGKVGYITDMLTMPDESYDALKDLDVLMINALRIKEHITHQTLDQALINAARIGAKETYLIHASHHLGLHTALESRLPSHVHLAYDGMLI